LSTIITETGDQLREIANTEMYINSRILSYLKDKTKKDYIINYMDSVFYEFVATDIKSEDEDIQFTADVYGVFAEYNLGIENDISGGLEKLAMNRIYKYKKFDIYVANIYYVSDRASTCNVVFSVSPEETTRFYNYIKIKHADIVRNKVIVIKENHYGIDTIYQDRVKCSLDSLVMDPMLKEEISRSVKQFFDADKSFFIDNKIPHRRGLLLYGDPGNGKSTIIRALASEIEAPVIYWTVGGQGRSEIIDAVFNFVAKVSPALLVIEDLDSISESSRSFFLNTLDGIGTREGIFIIGTTNYPERIDPAIVNRAGRFDRTYFFEAPDYAKRLTFIDNRGIAKFLAEDTDMAEIARLTDKFSFAQLNEVYTSVALGHYFDGKVDYQHIIKAMADSNKKEEKRTWYKKDTPVGFNA
jgi:AAA+ superfamily predicted ATPase